MSLSRRSFLRVTAGAGAALLLDRAPLAALGQQQIIRRPIPKSGEMLPIIGLGSVGTFNLTPDHPEYEAGREVLRRFVALGGKVIDTAPGYGNSESFIGESIQALGIRDDVFLATKFNALQISAGRGVRPSGGEAADKAVMESQLRESLATFGRRVIDLEQVWNLGDTQANAQRSSVPAGYLQWHIDKALEWKQAGLTRYIGITTSRDPQYAEVEAAMSRYPIDFVQLDYSIGDRKPEERLLPAAKDNGVAVLINRPFISGSLFRQASQRTMPEWAAELGIDTWGKFFLKYVVSHPAVTAAIPATGNPRNLEDNMGAGLAPLPDEAMRRRMREFWDAGR